MGIRKKAHTTMDAAWSVRGSFEYTDVVWIRQRTRKKGGRSWGDIKVVVRVTSELPQQRE